MTRLLNKLQIDILKRHVGPFIFCFLVVMFMLLMQFLILYIDKLVGKGLPLGVIIELILTNLAAMVVMSAPMAVLVACLMAFGKFTELHELTALRAAGVNPIHIINPVLGAATLLCLFLTWFANDVLPDSNQRARALFIDIRLKKPGFDLKPNEFYDGIDGYTFLVERIDSEVDSLYDVTLFQEATSSRRKAYIKADRGSLQSEDDGQTLTLMLEDGSIMRSLDRREGAKRVEVLEETHFDRYRISFDLSDLAFSRSNPDQHSRNDRTMKVGAMLAVVDTLRREIVEEKQEVYNNPSYIIPISQADTAEGTNSRRTVSSASRYSLEKDSTNMPYKSTFVTLNLMPNSVIQNRVHNLTLSTLRNYSSSYENLSTNVNWRISRIARYMVEVHKKFSIPLACIIFVLIGAPIGMYTKKGNLGYAALISTFFLTFYWITLIQGEKLADRLYISPAFGMWFSNVLLTIVGGYMVLRLCSSFRISNLWKKNE